MNLTQVVELPLQPAGLWVSVFFQAYDFADVGFDPGLHFGLGVHPDVFPLKSLGDSYPFHAPCGPAGEGTVQLSVPLSTMKLDCQFAGSIPLHHKLTHPLRTTEGIRDFRVFEMLLQSSHNLRFKATIQFDLGRTKKCIGEA